MHRSQVHRAALGVAFAGIFSLGYLLGTLDRQPADAQIEDLGKDLLGKATESGGMLGTAAQLGTTIQEMQTNVNELQENIDALNKIKEALGG